MKKIIIQKVLLLSFLLNIFVTVSAQSRNEVLSRLFNVGDVSQVAPSATDQILVIPAFLSVRRNQVQLLDIQNRQVDTSVMFVVEKGMDEQTRLFILDSKSRLILSCASLTGIIKKNNAFFCTAKYDRMLGHSNWVKDISFMPSYNQQLNMNAVSIIMDLDENLTLELVGVIDGSLSKPIEDILKK